MKLKTRIISKGRVCTKCNHWKYWKSFNKASKGFNGHRSSCRSCDISATSEWRYKVDYYKVNRNKILKHKQISYDLIKKKNYNLITKYGIILEEFNQIYTRQKSLCAICKCKLKHYSHDRYHPKLAVVDYNHKTGKVRGILCHTCNQAIGLLKDSSILLLRASKYVKN